MTVNNHALDPRQVVLGLTALFVALVVAVAVVIGAAAGIGAVWHATNPSSSRSNHAQAVSSGAPGSASVKLVIENVKTPDGSEPAYVGPGGVGDPVLFSVHRGVSTLVTVVNKTGVPHTFTSTVLGLDVTVPAGPSTVHFTVDAAQSGTAAWQCDFPCGAWVMSQTGYMMGTIKVLS